jgi:hypothetical protein
MSDLVREQVLATRQGPVFLYRIGQRAADVSRDSQSARGGADGESGLKSLGAI